MSEKTKNLSESAHLSVRLDHTAQKPAKKKHYVLRKLARIGRTQTASGEFFPNNEASETRHQLTFHLTGLFTLHILNAGGIFVEMDEALVGGDEFVIEVVDSSEIPPSELSQFEETLPLEYIDTVPDSPGENKPSDDTEETLIQKFVSGEVDFPDVYTRLDAEDDDDLPAESNTSNQVGERHFQEFAREGTTNTSLDDDDLGPGFGGRKASRTTFRKRPVLNATLLGLMGEANLCFARGQVEMAEKICLEIIRQNPLAPDPFFTLAEIYENRDKEKYLNFLTIAAHLDPHDRDQWIRIAEMYIEQKNYARARVYYSKAIKCLHKDYDLRLRKAKLLEMMNEHHNAMFTYLKMIPLVPVERGELCIVTAKNVARHFYTNKKMTYALEAMEGAYGVVRHLFSAEDINLFLELLMMNKNYHRVLYVLKEQTKVELITETQENDEELIMFCVIPDDMVADLRAKLCVSLIHLKSFHLLDYLITNIHKFIPISSRVDLYIDIAEAIMQESKFQEALRLLEPIISADEIEPPAFVWLRHAECLRELKRNEQAIESYFRVVELAPYCYDAKFTLSALLKQQGRHREAIKALEQDLEGEKMNPRLLYERCLMLKTVGEIDQYIDVGYVLLARNSIKLKSREEMMAASNGSSFINEDGVKTIIETRLLKQEDKNELLEYKKSADNNSDLTIEDEYHLFLDLVKTCYDRHKYGAMEKLCFAMVTTKRFMPYTAELECIIILACYFNCDTCFSFAYFREVFTKNIEKTHIWNFYTLLIQQGEDLRYHRFLRRALARSSSPQFMRIFLAHYHLYCCSYKYALNIYVPLLKEYPDPIVYMCISVVFSQIALQKKILRKPAAIGQAVAFMKKYADTRMCPETAQEVYYNMGRMYHQACMNHLAMHYYEKALALSNELVSKHESVLGLRQQIAFNMHLIYKASGNRDMARDCLYKYIVV